MTGIAPERSSATTTSERREAPRHDDQPKPKAKLSSTRSITAWLTLRRVRLASGLVLFSYLSLHLANHALGLVSLEAMEHGLVFMERLWQSAPGTAALYASLSTHLALGLWALYERRHLRWRRGEVVQIGLGVCIPLLLASHVLATRGAWSFYGVEKSYAQVLYALWVAAPDLGALQAVALAVAWTHGCLGIFYWLRLKPFFPKIDRLLLCASVLLPVLALLGFVEGGRAVAARAATNPAWRATILQPAHVGTPPQNDRLEAVRDYLSVGFVGAVGLVLLASAGRALAERRCPGRISITYPSGTVVRIPAGLTVLEASRAAQVPHASVCGGRGRCSTCRIRVVGDMAELPPPSIAEQAVLRRIGAAPGVRLACQLRPTRDVSVVPLVPPHAASAAEARRVRPDSTVVGEERFVVALVVDMRGSTRLAEQHLPFDTVFLVGRFLEAVGAAVTEAGGRPNQFLGDGMLALFGLDADPPVACRQALAAASRIAANLEELNGANAGDLAGTPLRFGIGIHGGTAIVGEMGYAPHTVLTALGDPINVAHRLQELAKDYECELVASDIVCRLAGPAPFGSRRIPRREVAIRGRSAALQVRLVPRLRDGGGGTASEIAEENTPI
jgi:adenylate cyclase